MGAWFVTQRANFAAIRSTGGDAGRAKMVAEQIGQVAVVGGAGSGAHGNSLRACKIVTRGTLGGDVPIKMVADMGGGTAAVDFNFNPVIAAVGG